MVFTRAIQKYGKDNFTWEILESNIKTQGELNILEKFWIVRLETRTTQWGYNIKEGGSNGRWSDESRKKLSDAKKGANNYN